MKNSAPLEDLQNPLKICLKHRETTFFSFLFLLNLLFDLNCQDDYVLSTKLCQQTFFKVLFLLFKKSIKLRAYFMLGLLRQCIPGKVFFISQQNITAHLAHLAASFCPETSWQYFDSFHIFEILSSLKYETM